MTQKIINTGTADKGNGDPIRTAFTKVNDNFTELYSHVSAGVSAGATPPETPGEGDLWWDSESGRLYVYFGTSWVDASPVDGAGISSTNELVNGSKTVSLASTGILTLPSSSYLESTDINLKVGAQGTVTIRSNAESNLTTREWEFDRLGTVTVPNLFPATFTAIVDSAHYYGEGSLTLEGNAWSFAVTFAINSNGTIETQITNNTPWPSNPGYIDGLEFRFVEADHGIPGYTFTLTLTDIQNPGPMMYTTNLAASIPPTLPATIGSPESIKLTADATSWTFSPDGNLTVPGDIKRGNSKLAFNENGGTNVYLTPTTDDSTAVFINDISVQAYARESVGLGVGSGLNALSVTHSELEAEWVDAREADAAMAAPAIREWAGLASWLAYPILLNSSPDLDPPMSPNLPPKANSAKQAYELWQNTKSDTTISMAVGDKVWVLDPDGKITLPNNGVIRTDDSNVEVGTVNNFNVEAAGVVNVYTNDGAHQWQFGDDGGLTFPDDTVQTTAFTGTATPNNITNSAGPSATIAVGGFAATRDHLSVRVTNNSNTLDVEINYSNPDSQALISVYRVYPGEGNLFGRTLKAANNTTWDLVTNLPAEGDSLSFTVTDHSYLKIYRVTVIADVMPGVPIAGEAFCVIEELK